MNSIKHIQKSLKLLLVCMVLVAGTSQAREMQPGTDAYNFSTYMIDAFYSEGEACEDKLLAAPTIGWLCAAFPLGERAFEQRWEAYLSALPVSYNITSVTAWGDIKYAEDDTVFYGKIYDLNDGRLVVGYDRENRGSEIRLGFSSTANQATSAQPSTVQATTVQAAATPNVQTQAVQTQYPQTQQEPVMLTYEQTRALELQQQQAAQQAQTLQNQQTTNQRAYATTQQSSSAMATAATTNMANSTVLNAAQNTVQQTMQPQTGSAAMTSAATTNMTTSAVVNQPTTTASLVQNALEQVQNTPVAQQVPVPVAAPVQVQNTAPAQNQELMAMAQSSPAQHLGASAILDVFRENGLSVEAPKAMTTKDYGFAPVLASEGLFFRIGECTSCIGRIFSFDRKEDVAMMEVYYSLEAQATDVVYSQDKVLLQFFSTPKELAEQYITELKALN